jgi:hypothetical protein
VQNPNKLLFIVCVSEELGFFVLVVCLLFGKSQNFILGEDMSPTVVFSLLSLLAGFYMAEANVVLMGNNVTLSFDDIEANFG